MFDTAQNADPVARIIQHTSEVLFAEKSGKRFIGGREQIVSALLCAAHKHMGDGDEKRLLRALIDLQSAEIDERIDEDALYHLDDAAAAVHAHHSDLMEAAS